MGARTDDFERFDAGTTLPFSVTWASTSADPAKRQRIGKIWAAEGKKWPVTDGVKCQTYVFELVRYPDLEAFSVDLEVRMRAGVSAIVAGRLKRLPELDPLQTHPRVKDNFDDDPSWLLQLDFDGLAAADARRIDRPEDFGAARCAKPNSDCPRRSTPTASSTRPARPAFRSMRRASRLTAAPGSAWSSYCRGP